MKKKKVLLVISLLVSLFIAESCGPVIISSRPDMPPPPWFYPNRVEAVRYVYFPDFMIYYDLSLRNYIYLNNGIWVTVDVLPPRYRTVNLRRSRYVRIKDYRGSNIKTYHPRNTYVKGRRTTTGSTRRQ